MRLTMRVKHLEHELGIDAPCPCGGGGLFVVLMPGQRPDDPDLDACHVCGRRRLIGVRERDPGEILCN